MLQMLLAALVLAVTALVVSGCGGSSKTGTNASTVTTTPAPSKTTAQTSPAVATREEIKIQPGKPLSRTVWLGKGDAICARTNEKLGTTTVKTTEGLARALPQGAAYDRAEANELSKLVPPPAMAADWRQIIAGIQKFGEFTARAAEYVKINQFAEAQPVIIAGTAVQKQLTTIAKRDGFKMCSQV